MRKINLTHIQVLAVLAFVFILCGCEVQDQDKLTFAMPACPIKATTRPPTFMDVTLPPGNPLGTAVSVSGTVQVTDQTSSTVVLTDITAGADPTSFSFARTVKILSHATGLLTFDKGCTKTDPYGSDNCTWNWSQGIRAASENTLQEDIQAGKLIVDLKINGTIPFQFSCPVCDATCTVTIPEQLLPVTSDLPPLSKLALFSALIGLVPPVLPGTIHLLGPPACPAGSNWSTAACWDLNRAPITSDDVVIANNAQASTNYDLDSGVALHSISISGASGAVAVTGGPISMQSGGSVTDTFNINGTDTLPGFNFAGPITIAVQAAGETLQISGPIVTTSGVTMTGPGTLLLSATSLYNGTTQVSGGTLAVNGSIAFSPVSVGSGGILTGTGTVLSIAAQPGGTVSGNLTATNGSTFAPGSNFNATIVGANTFSQLKGGAVTLNGPVLNVTVAGGFTPTGGSSFSIIPGAVTGTFNGLANGSLLSSGSIEFRIVYGSVVLTVLNGTSAIPTLSKWGLFLFSGLLMAAAVWALRKRSLDWV